MSNQDAIALRKRLEEMVVNELEKNLKENKITGERAQEIAKIFLATVPENISEEELLRIIPKLDDKASELAGVVYEILSDIDEEERNKKMEHLKNMLRSM